MGFGDKLKELRDQAQQAVAENKDRIQDAAQVVGDVANTKTKGKYANKIAKVGMKFEQGVDKFADAAPGTESTATETAAAGQTTAATAAADTGDAPTPPVAHEQADPATPAAAGEAAADELASGEAAAHEPASGEAAAHEPAAGEPASGFPEFE